LAFGIKLESVTLAFKH
jgi:hypothetical protein